MKLIIDIDEEDRTRVGNLHFIPEELKFEVAETISNGTPIPDNATNGDVIRVMFPDAKYTENFTDVEMKVFENDTRFCSVIDRDWYDTPYQKGGKE